MIDWQRLKKREDSEHEQALVRATVLFLVLCYFGIYSLFSNEPISALGLMAVSTHFAYSLLVFGHIYFKPQINPTRRVISMVFDMITGSMALYLLGEMSAIFFFLYLWVSISNGLRYGQFYLYLATATSAICFSIVLAYSDFWGNNISIGTGLLLALILLPVHFSVLLNRLSKANSNLNSMLKQTKRMASTDDLTGLPNRNSLFSCLNGTIEEANQTGSSFSVLFVDIDGFKEINDCYGHNVGDELLKAVAGRIKHQIRKDDTFSRIGGDEFVGILKNIEDSGAKRIAESILQSIQKPFQIDDLKLEASVSIGIATFPIDGHSSDSLLSRSDMAMYHAKRSGKNTVHSYSRAS